VTNRDCDGTGREATSSRESSTHALDSTRLDSTSSRAAIVGMVFARALERGAVARAGASDDVFEPARRAVRELGDAARVGAMRAMAATTDAVMRAGSRDVVRVRGRARRGANERNVIRCDPRLRGKCLAAMIPGDSAVESVITSGIFSTLNIYNTLIIGRLILTWFPNPPRQIMYPLATLCDPYLNLFRGIIPPLGGIDLSPILAFTVLNVFQGTAAALPCEYDEATGEVRMPNKRTRGFSAAQKRERRVDASVSRK